MDDGIQHRIDPVDPFDRRLDELERRQISAPDKLGLRGRVLPGQLLVHRTPGSSRRPGTASVPALASPPAS